MSSWAADLYVSASTGSDSNPGTKTAPFKTINKAASVVTAGSTVHVAPGTYYQNVSTTHSGTSTARIRYVSDTKWGAKVIGSGVNWMWVNGGSYVDIVGFDVSGSGRGGIANDGSHTLITQNHVHNLTVSGGCNGGGGAGIDNTNYNATDGDIIGNVVHDIGVPGSCNGIHGIYHSISGGKIQNNIVYRASAFGIHLWHAAKNATITNNTVFNNGGTNLGGGMVIGSGDGGGYNGTASTRLDNTIVANNIVYKNVREGISEYCSGGKPCIGPNVYVKNNLVAGSGIAISLLVGSATGTITSDPMFVNFQLNTLGDLHLKSGSPAIDKGLGIMSGAPSTDFDGVTRPQGAGVDIGAFEYPSGSGSGGSDSGSGAPVISLSATSFNFGSVAVGSTSTAQTLTIKNTGTANLSFTQAFAFSGPFSGSGNCYMSTPLVPGASCNLNIVFKPTATGAQSGSVKLYTNDANSPAIVALTGGAGPAISISATSFNFGSVAVGSTSAKQTLTIKNTGTANLSFTQAFAFSGPFSGSGNCYMSTPLVPGASCNLNMSFKPTATGAQSGSVRLFTNAPSSPTTVFLMGSGN